MNIYEIIKENLPEGIELPDKAIKAIAKEINAQQGKEFVPMEQYSLKTKELGELSGEIADLKATIASSGDWKTKYETEKTAHDTTKIGYETEKKTNAQDKALYDSLRAAGANEKLIPLLLKDIDRTKAKFDGDIDKGFTIKNADDILKPVKEKFSEVFGTVQTVGAGVASPPKGEPAKSTGHKDMNAFIRGVAE